ncbi:hypothetical protein [Morganella morganii]|jgi:hypothetical protein|uniref:Uncharacterized protein n=1 Tax=Morganella morganii TaxID=582 RepID=A0AAN5MHX6_MORMO|nr:hypothetical protein [Morganella morganii]MCU6212104.1 hypothetical protein [Morganella morganii]MCU6223404.1 hypothetical protein [Morganella morganii]MCU6234708.1 hypothetical protein [Morganella morganii]MCU6238220.1 hypothetical protein [Morganella morganii]HAT3810538.1 hypothetical protein [Morganella morganii]
MVHHNGAKRAFLQREPAEKADRKNGMIIAVIIADKKPDFLPFIAI